MNFVQARIGAVALTVVGLFVGLQHCAGAALGESAGDRAPRGFDERRPRLPQIAHLRARHPLSRELTAWAEDKRLVHGWRQAPKHPLANQAGEPPPGALEGALLFDSNGVRDRCQRIPLRGSQQKRSLPRMSLEPVEVAPDDLLDPRSGGIPESDVQLQVQRLERGRDRQVLFARVVVVQASFAHLRRGADLLETGLEEPVLEEHFDRSVEELFTPCGR